MNASTATVAVNFPGQGSQVKNMGRDLAESDSRYMEYWTLAEHASHQPLREIYWGGDDQDMADTRALQPALTVAALTLWMHAAGKVRPGCFGGHSLGEYPALAAARALEVEEVLELVSLRGALMAEAGAEDQGMTALLKVSQADAESVAAKAAEKTGGLCIVANFNTPAQFVLSGHKTALEAAGEMVREMKGRAIPLPVSGAFHSPLIAEAAAELEKRLKKARWKTPVAPVFLNVTAAAETDPQAIATAMGRQMTSPVRWIEINRNQYAMGARTFYEPGPKGVLTKMLGQNLKESGEDWTGKSLDQMVVVDELPAATD